MRINAKIAPPVTAGIIQTQIKRASKHPYPSGLTPVMLFVLLASRRYTTFAIKPGIQKKMYRTRVMMAGVV